MDLSAQLKRQPRNVPAGAARRGVTTAAVAVLLFGAAAMLAGGCSGTQYPYEGSGSETDRASGAVPFGAIGVCKRQFTRRPPIVNPELWEDAALCTSKTPKDFIRLGYGHEKYKPDAVERVDAIMETLREGPRQEGGNSQMLSMLKILRVEGENDPWLKDRISVNSARTDACDFTYLLNTMETEYIKLQEGDRCAAEAYNQEKRTEMCLFDTQRAEAVWLTSAWACITTGQMGREQSCHRLCAYDDYCTKQVSCVAPDLDLLLCAMGVCLPEQRDGFYYY